MKRLSIAVIISILNLVSVYGQGIKFEDLSWKQILAKAKAENKYIFVDCFATWCGPCKEMDKEIYPAEKVGAYFNDKFISVKVQMDRTKEDNEQVQQWYQDAGRIKDQYKITAFPSFLFFSPDGKAVHKALGYRDTTGFVALGMDALDPNKQYYALVKNYRQGKMRYKDMPSLASMAKDLGDKDLADVIANDYKKNYLDKLKDNQLCTKENLDFIIQYPNLINSKDRFFKLFYNHADKVDRTADDSSFAERYVKYIITKEEIDDKLWKGDQPVTKTPDWNNISSIIEKKYNKAYVESIVPEAQLSFYKRIQNWQEYARIQDEQIVKHPPLPGNELESDAWRLNLAAWDVFLHCIDKSVLSKALSWSDLSIKLASGNNGSVSSQFYDTNANLLYKLGRQKEAIAMEEKAIEAGIVNAKKRGAKKGDYFDVYTEALRKMKNGEPTYGAVWNGN